MIWNYSTIPNCSELDIPIIIGFSAR